VNSLVYLTDLGGRSGGSWRRERMWAKKGEEEMRLIFWMKKKLVLMMMMRTDVETPIIL